MKENKKSIGVSKLLEESIENTSILITLEERHLMREKIDSLDDIRRKEREKREDEFLEEMIQLSSLIYFSEYSIFRKNYTIEQIDLLKTKLTEYQNFIKKEREKEKYFEELDDLDREKLHEYIVNKKEESKDRSYRIELRIIENFQD